MGWKQWTLVAVVIGAGILLQIPGHGATEMESESASRGEVPESMADPPPPFRTVALEVTGMT